MDVAESQNRLALRWKAEAQRLQKQVDQAHDMMGRSD